MVRPCLPQNDKNPRERETELALTRELYQYDHDYPKGVALVADLPEQEQFTVPFVARIAAIQFKTLENSLASGAKRPGGGARQKAAFLSNQLQLLLRPGDLGASMGNQLTQMHRMTGKHRAATVPDFNELYQVLERPEIARNFEQDWVFAWQRLAGANPMVVERVDRLPDHYKFTEEHFARACRSAYGPLPTHMTLESARKEGRLYVADYRLLKDVPSGSWLGVQQFEFSPIALFAWFPPIGRHPARFMPIAIQAGQGGDEPVFDPESGIDWMMAKTAVQVADLTWHEARAHLGLCHMVMEAVVLATHRQLGAAHPLFILLTPHLRFTAAINDFAKNHLISPGGQVERYIAPVLASFIGVTGETLAGFNYKEVALKADLKTRGLDDTGALPLYPYRDDAIDLWNVIEQYIGEYLALYYARDLDVQEDHELRRWAEGLADPKRGNLGPIPVPETIADLQELITFFIFTASAQHAALNYTQWPFYGYVPSVPAAAYADVPGRPGAPGDPLPDFDQKWLRMLPQYDQALGQINLLYLLAGIHYNKLGHYPCGHFDDLRVMPVVRRFLQRLDKVETDSKGRNGNRPMSYSYLFPSNVPQSIHI